MFQEESDLAYAPYEISCARRSCTADRRTVVYDARAVDCRGQLAWFRS